jgi:hypothetical protein
MDLMRLKIVVKLQIAIPLLWRLGWCIESPTLASQTPRIAQVASLSCLPTSHIRRMHGQRSTEYESFADGLVVARPPPIDLLCMEMIRRVTVYVLPSYWKPAGDVNMNPY